MRKLLVLAVIAACAPDIEKTAPTGFATAVFDPTTSEIPLPNDLAFLNPLNSVCNPPEQTSTPPKCAQAELLASFAGKFPSDQEVAVTIDFTQTSFDDKGQTANTAPDLDLTSFTSDKFFVYGISGGAQGEAELEPLVAADYVKGTTKGTLSIHHKDHQPWAGGAYVVAVRGGPDGVKTKDGSPIYASQVFDLIEQGQDMTDPKNLGLLKAQFGSLEAAQEQGRQLNQVIAVYKQTLFPIADAKFPHQQLAVGLTFQTQAEVTNVSIDPARSLVPLPIDLLRDPTTGKLTDQAACAFLSDHVDEATGKCMNAAAAGFLALDGFSTTGAILAPTSELIEAKTVTGTSLRLYELAASGPVQVPAQNLILEPCEFTSGCTALNPLSPVIAIQPAGATAGDPTSVLRTKPLKDNTSYAVVMTTDIKDKAGNAIGPGTVAKIVRFQNPIADAAGKSQLIGISDTIAQQLEKMRKELAPVLAQLATEGLDSSKLGMAYTFHTQTILATAAQLGALPYTLPAATAQPSAVTALTPAAAFAKYGVDPAVVPLTNIDEILEADIHTANLLSPLTGAFDPNAPNDEVIHVLIATPKVTNANVPACAGALTPFGHCAPMMIFRHGLGRGRADMLTIADSYAAAGMTTVAIDAAKHGDRSFCTPSGPAAQCASPATCTTPLPGGAQGDASPPGTCTDGKFQYLPVMASCATPGSCGGYAYAEGIPAVSGNYLVTTNFFRTRDTFRQDFIDESQLTRAIAFVPAGAPPTGHTVFDHMVARGVIIDPATIYFSGQSLGAITGTGDVASNPRIQKAGLNVGGGTIVDIFTNSPAFASTTNALLAGLGIQPGTSQYLQFLVVAKTVLDPADPINYAGHITTNTLPNLLVDQTGATPQAPKKLLDQAAFCDQTVPNPFNLILANNMLVTPLPPTGAPGTVEVFWNLTTGGVPNAGSLFTCVNGSTPGAVPHGFITNWSDPVMTSTAQSDIANFVMHDTLPPSVRVLP